jgi:hypothetical protein
MSSSQSRSRGRKRPATSTTKTTSTSRTSTTRNTTTYDRDFEQNLIDHGIYPEEYEHPDGREAPMPKNWDEINQRLTQPRASLSPSKFSDQDFKDFKRANAHAFKEKQATNTVIPIIEGKMGDGRCVAGDIPFNNLDHLTDGTIAPGKPDLFYGAHPEQLDRRIRLELSSRIIPSTLDDLPIAPNFFLEAKGPDGSAVVARRQACYDGALGASGFYSLLPVRLSFVFVSFPGGFYSHESALSTLILFCARSCNLNLVHFTSISTRCSVRGALYC